ncbi:protein FAM98B [Scaptodrosophila lebanonensis]|uniref:Protein FAM98B n=1 Tax=Drosophila lebanonensis TaxID=7225 RepID=A0A6J2TCF0_DROLE|nr:protein FAM98B [Scaptodrosophila lebanonensis]
MERELDIIDSLQALCYKGICLEQETLRTALDSGMSSDTFRDVVFWLANELAVLRKTDEHISSSKDNDEFTFELSLLLTELGCPYQQFVTLPMSERFKTRESLLQLLDYLTCELMATKMSLKMQPSEPPSKKSKIETNVEEAVKQLSADLQVELPKNLNGKTLFEKLQPRLEQRLKQVNRNIVSEPLLKTSKSLTDAQWRMLEAMHKDLDMEYNLRREMMLTRLEATVQSFQWSESMKHREKEINDRFQRKMLQLGLIKYGGEDTNIVALLAARSDLAVIEKTSSANVRKNTASKIQKHVIGNVPDRGGRAHEHAPPPPEMPSWQQQRAGGPARGGGNFRGGGGQGRGDGNFRGHGGGGRGGSGGGGGGGRGGSGGGRGGGGNWSQQPQEQRDQQWIGGSGRVQGAGWNQNSRGYQRGGYR